MKPSVCLLALVFGALVPTCRDNVQTPRDQSANDMNQSQRDNEIAAILATVDRNEISEGRMASTRGTHADMQVEEHRKVLEMIDNELLRDARNPALRQALRDDVRPMVGSHLEQAQNLRGRL